jgi:small subunit ribosomal protein S6
MVSKRVEAGEDTGLRDYELIIVLSPELNEEEIEANTENVRRFVTERGGSISDLERWGKRRLAYPIKHFGDGYYILTHFKLGPTFGRELEANLHISEVVLRHLLVRLDSQ